MTDRIELRLASALLTLDYLIASGTEPLDFGFIGANKVNYETYYERLLQLIRPGGLITFYNVLWGGSVIDPAKRDADTAAIRRLNARLRDDERVARSMLPVADGLTLARVRG